MKWVRGEDTPNMWRGWLLQLDADETGEPYYDYVALYKFRSTSDRWQQHTAWVFKDINGNGNREWIPLDLPPGLTDEEAMNYIHVLFRMELE
jgi:hypothetical protein